MNIPLVTSRSTILDARAVLANEVLIVSALRDVLPIVRALKGIEYDPTGEAGKVHGISPGSIYIGPQADPLTPVNILCDQGRNLTPTSVSIVVGSQRMFCDNSVVSLVDNTGAAQIGVLGLSVQDLAGNYVSVQKDSISFNNVKILGPQQNAVADAIDAGDIVDQFNLAMAGLRNMGIFAT